MRKVLVVPAALLSIWACAALYFDFPVPALRLPAALCYGGVVVAALWLTAAARKKAIVWAGTIVPVMGWWFSLAPSNAKPWLPDVAELPWVERQGDIVSIHNVRNAEYRAEFDYVPHWETRTVDLAQIHGVDLFVIHFGSPLIAHAILSFQFRGDAGDGAGKDTFLAFSIEARKTVGQSYSPVRGFFRQFQLMYLVADERDVVRLRTNFRVGEDVRLYHTLTKPDDARRLFLQYLTWMEEIREHPRWYNALTENCTSSITSYLVNNGVGRLSRWDWRIVLNGAADRMLYESGDLATGGLSFEALSQQALINDAAKKLGDDPNFSQAIRRGHPGFD
jgi:hypothetical protein